MSPTDSILLRYLGAELIARGAFALPLPPRVPSFGAPRQMHLPVSGVPAGDATVRPMRSAA